MLKRIAVALIIAVSMVLGPLACNLLNRGDSDEEKRQTNLMLLLGAAILATPVCTNTSGLVICIPPGLRF